MRISRRLLLSLSVVAFAACVVGVRPAVAAEEAKRVVVVWSEGTAIGKHYPKDINTAVADGLKASLEGWEVVVAGIDDPDQGLSDSLLNRCDVLVWWGHKKHGQVKDALADKIVKRVKEDGMGFISLHSAHFAKPNIKLMSQMETKAELFQKVQPKNRVAAWGAYVGDSLDLTISVKDAAHPIAAGVKEFTIAHHERYSDPYAVPQAKSIVFTGVAKLKNGKTDASEVGFTWDIGKGRMFYFQAGHETDPVFCDENVKKIMANAVKWAAPEKK